MQTKLGNMLVQEKVITEAQLEDALRNQVIFGGKVGTNLIELGYITPEVLAEYLSRHSGIPQVRPADLHAIPPNVIAIIPPEVAKQHQVLPIRVEKKKLTVAMANPADLATTDKLSFMTGMYINPVVIPELLLIMALERYYKIKRETRYIAIAKDMRRPAQPAVYEQEEPSPAPAPVAAAPAAEDDVIEIPEFDGFHKVDIPEVPVKPVEAETYSMSDMCTALAGAMTRDAIGEALMEYLRVHFFRAGLFLPKEPMLTGWVAAEQGGYIQNFPDFRLEMAAPSSFLQVIETKNFCMGQLHSPTDLKAASAIGAKDNPVVLLPIVLMGRVVAILCVVDSLEKLSRSLTELQKIAVKSAMAFEILIMRNKIQMV